MNIPHTFVDLENLVAILVILGEYNYFILHASCYFRLIAPDLGDEAELDWDLEVSTAQTPLFLRATARFL